MNNSWSKYYEQTKSLQPSNLLIEAFESFNLKPGIAIDLGCGAGRDARYLLEKGFTVKAVDKDPIAKKYLDLLPHQERVGFTCADFGDFTYSHYDLINAHYALPFIEKASFDSVMKKIVGSINVGGMFVGQLFGPNDEWNTPESTMYFCKRADVNKLFKNFKVLEIKEVDEEGTTANGSSKHWHVFNIIAQK